MPTAVERIFSEFLKLDVAGAEDQRVLTNAFTRLDADLLKIESTGGGSQRDFLKVEAHYGQDIWKIGVAYLETGEDFSRIANFAGALDAFLVKLTTPTTPPSITLAAATTVSPLQDDFLILDAALKTSGADLKIFGGDLLKAAFQTSADDFALKIHAAGAFAGMVSTEMEQNSSAFLKISIEIEGEAKDSTHKGEPDVHALTNALNNISDDFLSLRDDFLKIETSLGGGAVNLQSLTAPGLTASFVSTNLSPVGAAFTSANDDFLKLNADFAALATPAAHITTSLVKAASGGGGGTAFP